MFLGYAINIKIHHVTNDGPTVEEFQAQLLGFGSHHRWYKQTIMYSLDSDPGNRGINHGLHCLWFIVDT